jgi:trans-aconitate 2-methyltransferase
VIAVDGSPSMLELARETLADVPDRVRLINADLLELSPELLASEAGVDAVDLVFSNATFHWIGDHDALFMAAGSVLRSGGRLVAQCGGGGNVTEWVAAVRAAGSREPFAEYVDGFSPWNFQGAEETERRLEASGFEDVACSLERKVVHPEDSRGFVAVVGLASIHERLPDELREPFTDAVLAELTEPLELTYIRLNMEGTRS